MADCEYASGMLGDVVTIIGAEVHPLGLGTIGEVFGVDRSDDGLPGFDFAVCAARPGPRRGAGGLLVDVTHGLDRAATADLVAIPGWDPDLEPVPDEVIEALRAAVDRGATVLSVCSGVFLLAAAGLLEGRLVACHERHVERLLARHPDLDIDVDELYIEDGPIVTSAGTAAGIDACLQVVSRELGADVAHELARRMVPARRHDDDDADADDGYDVDGYDVDTGDAAVPSGTGSGTGSRPGFVTSLLDWLSGPF